jgi:hypothetical protein
MKTVSTKKTNSKKTLQPRALAKVSTALGELEQGSEAQLALIDRARLLCDDLVALAELNCVISAHELAPLGKTLRELVRERMAASAEIENARKALAS